MKIHHLDTLQRRANALLSGCMLMVLVAPVAHAVVDFEDDVLPIFQEKCFSCHSDRVESPAASLIMDNPEALLKGSEYGPIIKKMLPAESELIKRITLPPEKQGIMPPAGKGDPCTPEQLKIIRNWIKEGARTDAWQGNPEVSWERPPKTVNNSRLSLEKYGQKKGISGLDLSPKPKYEPRISSQLVQARAAQIDDLVDEYRKSKGVNALPTANDRIFSRRAYLGIVGRTPTLEESMAFLSANDSNKRRKLIDHLITTEGYVSHWFNFWADLLKVENIRFNSSVYYSEWIKEALRNNMPYDRFSYELITATGMAHQNGATGWTASDRGMAEDHTANTMQVFMGMQLQCAQCHDHPFDRWNQYEFQSLVSYYGGVRWDGAVGNYFVRKAEREGLEESMSEKQKKFLGNPFGNNYRYAVWEPSFNKWNRLPKDYQYADARPQQSLPPNVLFGENPEIQDSPREAFGTWVTNENNEYFTKTVVNRLWKQTMGVGLIEPVDHIKYDTEPAIPELLTLLEETMKLVDYNLKDFLRILYNTKTWQMETISYDLPENLYEYTYEGRPLMRLTGEQMWDSLVSLAIVDPDDRKGHGSRYTTDEFRKEIEEAFHMPLEKLIEVYDDERIDTMKTERKQAEKAASKLFNSKTKIKAGSYGANFGSWSLDHMTDPRWHGMDRGLVRASELASPAPSYHFIRQFGQSDRKVIGTGRTDPNVSQILNMLNGPIHYILDNQLSVLSKELNNQETAEDKITVIFRSVLSRNPTEEDLEIAGNVIKANPGRQGYRMILWALLNTREFMFIQ